MIDFSNKKKMRRISAIIVIVLVVAMVVGLLVTSISQSHIKKHSIHYVNFQEGRK